MASNLGEALAALFRDRGFRLADQPGEINIAYIEGANEDGSPNANTPNAWNDRRVVFSTYAVLGNWEATCEPGKFYTDSPLDPRGAARIALGQHLAAWRVGIHNRLKKSAHEALVQVAPVCVHRDANKDYSRAGDPEFSGLWGLNQHHGWNMPVNDIGKASAACLVGRTKAGHAEFLQLIKADPRYVADPRFAFDTAVIAAAELQPFL